MSEAARLHIALGSANPSLTMSRVLSSLPPRGVCRSRAGYRAPVLPGTYCCDAYCPRIMACLPAVGELSEGVYEKVRTIGLDEALTSLPPEYRPDFLAVDPADATDVVAMHVAEVVRRAISSEPETRRVALTNELLAMLAAPEEQLPGVIEHLIAPTRRLAPSSRTIPRPVTLCHRPRF